MCKFTTVTVYTHIDGPFSFRLRKHADTCIAFWQPSTWREAIASVLRRLADRMEKTNSFIMDARGPRNDVGIGQQEALDALVIGINGANKYLNDLWRDRSYVGRDEHANL